MIRGWIHGVRITIFVCISKSIDDTITVRIRSTSLYAIGNAVTIRVGIFKRRSCVAIKVAGNETSAQRIRQSVAIVVDKSIHNTVSIGIVTSCFSTIRNAVIVRIQVKKIRNRIQVKVKIIVYTVAVRIQVWCKIRINIVGNVITVMIC